MYNIHDVSRFYNPSTTTIGHRLLQLIDSFATSIFGSGLMALIASLLIVLPFVIVTVFHAVVFRRYRRIKTASVLGFVLAYGASAYVCIVTVILMPFDKISQRATVAIAITVSCIVSSSFVLFVVQLRSIRLRGLRYDPNIALIDVITPASTAKTSTPTGPLFREEVTVVTHREPTALEFPSASTAHLSTQSMPLFTPTSLPDLVAPPTRRGRRAAPMSEENNTKEIEIQNKARSLPQQFASAGR